MSIDLLAAVGRFAAHAEGAELPWLTLTDSGLDDASMAALIGRKLAERSGTHAVYRLTDAGKAEAEELAGASRFNLDALLSAARRTVPSDANSGGVARCAVLLTCDDDLRAALRMALLEVLAHEDGERAVRKPYETAERAASNGHRVTSEPSRWERAAEALASEAVVVTLGPSQTKALADCTAQDLRAASAYYSGTAVEAARRSRACDALIEALETWECVTVADLERVAPDRLREVWS